MTLGLVKDFLGYRKDNYKGKMDKLDIVSIEHFCSLKSPVRK